MLSVHRGVRGPAKRNEGRSSKCCLYVCVNAQFSTLYTNFTQSGVWGLGFGVGGRAKRTKGRQVSCFLSLCLNPRFPPSKPTFLRQGFGVWGLGVGVWGL